MDRINKTDEKIVRSVKKDYSFRDIAKLYKKNYSNIVNSIIEENKDKIINFSINRKDLLKQLIYITKIESNIRATNVYNCMKENKVFGDDLWNALLPKIFSEIRISSKKLELIGRVDQILQFQDVKIPVEVKTGKMPSDGTWPEHRTQIGAYIMILNENENTDNRVGFVRYFDSNNFNERKVVFNVMLEEKIIDIINKIKDLMSGISEPKPIRSRKCESCPLKDYCK